MAPSCLSTCPPQDISSYLHCPCESAEQKLQKAFSGIMRVFWGLGVHFKKGRLKVPALVLHGCAHLRGGPAGAYIKEGRGSGSDLATCTQARCSGSSRSYPHRECLSDQRSPCSPFSSLTPLCGVIQHEVLQRACGPQVRPKYPEWSPSGTAKDFWSLRRT